MNTITSAAEPIRADFERREPRCRICRNESVRLLVNDLLDWHRVPVPLGGGKTHRITYAEILRALDPLNEGRDKSDRITYDSLWNHAKRHYDFDGVSADSTAQVGKMLRNAFGSSRTALK